MHFYSIVICLMEWGKAWRVPTSLKNPARQPTISVPFSHVHGRAKSSYSCSCIGREMEGAKLSHHGPTLFDLCSANDLLLFGVSSKKQACIIEEVITKFCRQSRQRVNVEKFQQIFSANVQAKIALNLSIRFSISISQSLGTYLRMLIILKCVSKGIYHFLLEKTRRKLSSWKGRNLSMASDALLI